MKKSPSSALCWTPAFFVFAVAGFSLPSTHRFSEGSDALHAALDSGQDPEPEKPEDVPGRRAPDLSQERALLAESQAAIGRSDYAAARAHAVEAVHSLLARPAAEQDEAWLDLLDSTASAAREAQDARTAKQAWQQVLEIRENRLPRDHSDLLLTQMNLAATMGQLRDFAGAHALFERVLEAYERTLPEDHPHLLAARQNLALTSHQLGDLHGSRVQSERVLAARERTLPEDHPALLASRQNLAMTIKALGDLEGARALEERVLEARERTSPEDHPDLLRARQNLAVTIKRLGDLEGARELEESALRGRERTLPEDHPSLLNARENLAGTLHALGDHAAANALYRRVLEARERTLPEDHADTINARGNLALSIKALGDLHGARWVEERVLEARERTLPKDHPDLLRARQNLAVTIKRLGDLHGARALEESVLEIRERTLPEDHPHLLDAQHNLAVTLKQLGDLNGALALEKHLLEARERTLPEDHPALLASRQNLAVTLKLLGDLDAALELEERVLKAREHTLPEGHPDLLGSRQNLAVTLNQLGDLVNAQMLEENVLEARERGLPKDHPHLAAARLNLAGSLARAGAHQIGKSEGKWARAVALVAEVARSQAQALGGMLLGGSARESEERAAWGAERPLGYALSFAAGLRVFDRSAALTEEAFSLSESCRGAGFMFAALVRSGVKGPEVTRLRAEIRAASAELVDLARGGAASEEFHQARRRGEAAERELLALARQTVGESAAVLEGTAKGLRRILPQGQALVGYRRYTETWFEVAEAASEAVEPVAQQHRRLSLGAFVLARPEGAAEARLAFVELGPLDSIEDLVHGWRATIRATPERGIATGAEEDPSSKAGEQLRRAVWDRLLEHLDGAGRVVVALDDILHLVPLDALPLEQGAGLIGDRWRIETRNTLWELLDAPPALTGRGALLSLGGASFNSPPVGLTAEDLGALEPEPDEMATSGEIALLRGGAWERGFAPLTYTRTEARGLAELFAEAFEEHFDDEVPALVLDRARASRGALVEAAPRARFLHVATHGWFAPESVRSWADADEQTRADGLPHRLGGEDTVRGMSPMLLCGLALAGANLPADAIGRVPGLMTAEELSTLDLTGCELAVLSACDTNVGERRAGQGVASLQKALHMAGARSVITSLWKVPDEATSELMLDFYRRLWVEKKPKHQALWEAKQRLRNARDERGEPLYTVRDWAAWVLTGEPD